MSYARLSDIKRVDRIVRAFQKMPERRVIIHHGANDPESENIRALIGTSANIELISYRSEGELIDAIRKARAVIYIPKDEDFGMIPIEAMACGVPVIGVRE